MLVSFFSCPYCDQAFSHVSLIKHLKELHNTACARLIEFYDPRYYLRLVRAVVQKEEPLAGLNIFDVRDDGVLTSHSQNENDMQLRKIAFIFYRKRAFYQYNFEQSNRKFLHCCFLCQTVLQNVSRREALLHYEYHGLRVGGVEGIVYIYKLLKIFEDECADNKCMYCCAQFRDAKQLRKHLKERNHLRFRANRNDVDFCFLTNYREYQKNWRYNDNETEAEDDQASGTDFVEMSSDDEYDQEIATIDKKVLRMLEDVPPIDLQLEEDDTTSFKCLFCDVQKSVEEILAHMRDEHAFDIGAIMGINDVYQRIMQINYFRRKVEVMQCPLCDAIFAEREAMKEHFRHMDHGQLRILSDECDIIPFVDGDYFLQFVIGDD